MESMKTLAIRECGVTQHQECCPTALVDWDHCMATRQSVQALEFLLLLLGGDSQLVRGQDFEGARFEEPLICATVLWLFRGASQ